jgi:hypothetical protein
MRRHSHWIWGGRIAAVAVVAGLAGYLLSAGLDKADKLASVLGLLVAVAALAAPYLLPSPDRNRSEPGSSQHVVNTVVGGHLTQVQNAKSVPVTSPVSPSLRQAAPGTAGPMSKGQGGQYVNGVWVGGNLTQVDGANDDDVTTG